MVPLLGAGHESGRLHDLSARIRRNIANLRDAIEAALDWKAPDVRNSTLARYREGLDHFLRFIDDDDASVADVLTEDRLQKFKGFRLHEGAARQTINNDLIAVSILVTHALKNGWISERPKVKKFPHETRIRWLDPGQLASYMAALRPRFRLQMQVLLASGMRLGESEGLRGCDLRLGEGDNRAMITKGKTVAAVRTVFLPEWVAVALAEYIEDCGLAGQDRLFTISRRVVQREHDRACELVGIVDYRLHDHRHTAAVHLAQAGIPLHLLQKQLGHKHIEVTMKYAAYHPDYSEVADYFKSVGEKLGVGVKNGGPTQNPRGLSGGLSGKNGLNRLP